MIEPHQLTEIVELRSAGSSENLNHIQKVQINESTLLRVVHLGALDDDRMTRQVHAPS